MYTIYIDTHFADLVVALFKDYELVVDKKIVSAKHTENAVNLIKEVLDEVNITVKDLGQVIVVNGPGSFTGVRIGVVIAKTISYSLNIPVKAVSYLELMALNYNQGVILGIEDRNGVFVGHFDDKHNLVEDYFYLDKKEIDNYSKKIIIDDNVSIEKVIYYVKGKKDVLPHLLKPLYVKKIEVEND